MCLSKDLATVVKLPLGLVEGYIKETLTGRKLVAFEGVPYAQPPVGEFRFKVNKQHWDATQKSEASLLKIIFLASVSSRTMDGDMESRNNIQMSAVWSFHTTRC